MLPRRNVLPRVVRRRTRPAGAVSGGRMFHTGAGWLGRPRHDEGGWDELCTGRGAPDAGRLGKHRPDASRRGCPRQPGRPGNRGHRRIAHGGGRTLLLAHRELRRRDPRVPRDLYRKPGVGRRPGLYRRGRVGGGDRVGPRPFRTVEAHPRRSRRRILMHLVRGHQDIHAAEALEVVTSRAAARCETEDTELLLEKYAASRDPALRDQILEAYLPLSYHLAHRFRNRGEPIEDLTQVAALAMVKAIDRFDPERGVRFSTFAVPTIVGELKRHFRDRVWAVRVPRRLKDLR